MGRDLSERLTEYETVVAHLRKLGVSHLRDMRLGLEITLTDAPFMGAGGGDDHEGDDGGWPTAGAQPRGPRLKRFDPLP